MAVVFRCQSEMATAFCGVFRLLHGTQYQTADHCFIGKSFDTFDDLLDFLWCDLFFCFLNFYPLVVKQCQKTFHFLRVRIIMGSVYKWNLFCTVFLCYSFICHQHEILDNSGCHIRFIRLYIDRFSCCIEDDLALREIKVNGASVVTAVS